MCRSAQLATVLALSTFAVSFQAQAQSLSFLACPVAQDLGPQRDLCFFAMRDGVRYGLSSPQDWGNPQLGHKVLVEAEVADRPQECGGLAIDGRVSVMPELSPECDEIAPAMPEFLAEELPARLRLSDEDRLMIDADPKTSLRIVRLPALPVPEVALRRTETIYFPFESDRASGPDAMKLLELARLAVATPGARMEVRAYRGASLLDTGQVLTERPDMARKRGKKIADILGGLGVSDQAIALEVIDAVPNPSGTRDWEHRRVELRVSSAQ